MNHSTDDKPKFLSQVHDSDSFVLPKEILSVDLGSDNSSYHFTKKWIKTVYKTRFPNVNLALGDAFPSEIMTSLLDMEEMQWQRVAKSDFDGLRCVESSLETWYWSLNLNGPLTSFFS